MKENNIRGGHAWVKIFLPILLVGVGLVSCSTKRKTFEEAVYWLPWLKDTNSKVDQEKKYEFQKVKIKTLKITPQIEGPYANFYLSPSVSRSGTFFKGQVPQVSVFESADGVFTPKDVMSTELISLYAHLERLATLDQRLGVDLKKLWPMNIGIGVQSKDESGRFIDNNAFYFGKQNALLIVPYTAKDLPISLNGGVIAHEHFHGIFQKMVIDKLEAQDFTLTSVHGNEPVSQAFDLATTQEIKEDRLTPTIYNKILLRALNEGMADFFAWVYTRDSYFIGRSLRFAAESRSLKVQTQEFPSLRLLKSRFNYIMRNSQYEGFAREAILQAESYRLGSYYARFFKDLAESLPGKNQAELVARHLIKNLNILANDLLREKYVEKEFLSMNMILRIFSINWVEKEVYCHKLRVFSANDLAEATSFCEAVQ